MSCYRTGLSFILPTKEELTDQIVAIANCVDEMLTYGDDDPKDLAEQGYDEKTIEVAQWIAADEGSWGVNVVKHANGKVWIHADDNPDIDALITFIQKVLTEFDCKEVVSFQWSNWSDEATIGDFGGGAAVISQKGLEVNITDAWISATTKKMEAV